MLTRIVHNSPRLSAFFDSLQVDRISRAKDTIYVFYCIAPNSSKVKLYTRALARDNVKKIGAEQRGTRGYPFFIRENVVRMGVSPDDARSSASHSSH
jgi:hypothetical protein